MWPKSTNFTTAVSISKPPCYLQLRFGHVAETAVFHQTVRHFSEFLVPTRVTLEGNAKVKLEAHCD